MEIKFTKMHGLGNDYIYIDNTNNDYNLNKDIVMKICNRNTGIGSDGVILIEHSNSADFKMVMYNSDGSIGNMCGNGIRCFGKYCFEKKLTTKDALIIETKAGYRKLFLNINNNIVESIRVDMDKPILSCKDIPVVFSKEQMINEKIIIDHTTYEVTAVSMGNPHAVLFVDDLNIDIDCIGKAFECSNYFIESVNTNFVKVIDKHHIELRVFERGSGETLACGTGACASMYACYLLGKVEKDIKVHLIGGILDISFDGNNIWMEGSANEVFTGLIEV